MFRISVDEYLGKAAGVVDDQILMGLVRSNGRPDFAASVMSLRMACVLEYGRPKIIISGCRFDPPSGREGDFANSERGRAPSTRHTRKIFSARENGIFAEQRLETAQRWKRRNFRLSEERAVFAQTRNGAEIADFWTKKTDRDCLPHEA
jgi:hypothetical protein